MNPTGQFDSRKGRAANGVDSGKLSTDKVGTQPTHPVAKSARTELSHWVQTGFSFTVMMTAILITVVFIMARGGMGDPDIWWHLRNAEYLINFHQLPRFDLYSFTAAGHPWINHEWLSEIPFYLVWRAWGLAGIKSLVILLAELIFLGLLYLCYKESGNFKAAVIACCFSTFLASVSFGPRTILFGYLYLIVLLVVLQRFRRGGRASLWFLPALFCLWANTHGSWLLGLIVFGIIVAAGLLKGKWGHVEAEPWTSSQLRQLVAVGLASLAALFVNPFGSRLVFYPFNLAFRQKLNIAHVAEWVSVNFHDLRGKLVLTLLVILLVSALRGGCRWTLAELGLVLFGLYSGLTYIRFLFLVGIVTAPVIAKVLDFVPPYRPEIDKPLLNALLVVLMMGGVVRYWPRSAELESIVDQQFPANVLPYLRAHPPAGPMLNFYTWGGYLGWNDRNLKVFIDSRVDIFEYAGVFKDYLDLLGLKDPKNILDKYQIRYVLFPPDEPLTYALQHDPEWKVLYGDRVSVLLERVGNTSRGDATRVGDGPR
jgi:hypothetical protein